MVYYNKKKEKEKRIYDFEESSNKSKGICRQGFR